jgi:hypothetical protein
LHSECHLKLCKTNNSQPNIILAATLMLIFS